MSTPELRKKLKAWYLACDTVDVTSRRLAAERRLLLEYALTPPPPLALPVYPPFPPECEGMRCGAKAKSTGEPCKSTQLYRSGRCKFHGGLSRGPKSDIGKALALCNLKQFAEP